MSRRGITYQEVANAAIQLRQVENPTVDRVRGFLGTGSKSTIARYLKDWKSKTEYVASSNGTNISVLNDQNIRLRKSLKNSENHIHVLHDEKLFLAQKKSQLEGQLMQTEKILLIRSNKVVEQ